ncbi:MULTISPECIES: hypothetical protein [unclassified Streptomyces]|uniref:hypothetical protein n=1 Tax=unclassified Streptomyces TaxID=2593676 RepID=UPI002E36251A|nr:MULTISPECIES: hypothetical protein [unclassified Streptomyces]WUC64891.1 hypothetical protein OG861_11940 [Streptomyces sp. NBC_00539]
MERESDQQPQNADRPSKLWTGGERPYDPEDLVMATGADLTPERVEKARKMIEREGPSVIERYLP